MRSIALPGSRLSVGQVLPDVAASLPGEEHVLGYRGRDDRGLAVMLMCHRISEIGDRRHGAGPTPPSPWALPERVVSARADTPGLCLRGIVWRILRREPGQQADRILPERGKFSAARRPGLVAVPELAGQGSQFGKPPGGCRISGQPGEQRIDAGGQISEDQDAVSIRHMMHRTQRGDLVCYLATSLDEAVRVAYAPGAKALVWCAERSRR
jgi:hypothetical protein